MYQQKMTLQNIAATMPQDWTMVNQYLRQLLSSDSKSSLSEGVRALALQLAMQVLQLGDFRQRWDVAKLFPQFGRQALTPLVALWEDREAQWEARWFAGRILGKFEEPEAILALLNVLLEVEDDELAEVAVASLAEMGTVAVDALTSLLAQPQMRLMAVLSLAAIRRPETIEPLLSVTSDPSPEIRAIAIEALSSFHDDRIPLILLQALEDKAAAVKKEAVIGLGARASQLPQFDLVSALKPLLYDLNLEVCRQAAIALGRLGTEAAFQVLFPVLQSSLTPAILKLEIVRVLSWTQSPLTLTYLQASLEQESVEICQEIIAAIGRWHFPELKTAATQVLIQFLDSERDVLESPTLRQTLALSLGQLGESSAIEPLLKFAEDSDRSVRLHALAALQKMPQPLLNENILTDGFIDFAN